MTAVHYEEEAEARGEKRSGPEVTQRCEPGEESGTDRELQLASREQQIRLVQREDREQEPERARESATHDEPREAARHERERGERGDDGGSLGQQAPREQEERHERRAGRGQRQQPNDLCQVERSDVCQHAGGVEAQRWIRERNTSRVVRRVRRYPVARVLQLFRHLIEQPTVVEREVGEQHRSRSHDAAEYDRGAARENERGYDPRAARARHALRCLQNMEAFARAYYVPLARRAHETSAASLRMRKRSRAGALRGTRVAPAARTASLTRPPRAAAAFYCWESNHPSFRDPCRPRQSPVAHDRSLDTGDSRPDLGHVRPPGCPARALAACG